MKERYANDSGSPYGAEIVLREERWLCKHHVSGGNTMSDKCVTPKGWKCTRDAGHDGPCAAVKVPWYERLTDAVGTAIGEAMDKR